MNAVRSIYPKDERYPVESEEYAMEIPASRDDKVLAGRIWYLEEAIRERCDTVCEVRPFNFGPDGGGYVIVEVQGEREEDVKKQFPALEVIAMSEERYKKHTRKAA